MLMAGDRVQHRAWFNYGVLIAVPDEITHLAHVDVKWDDKEGIRNEWLPSLITETDDFIYDWSGADVSPKRRPKGTSKKH